MRTSGGGACCAEVTGDAIGYGGTASQRDKRWAALYKPRNVALADDGGGDDSGKDSTAEAQSTPTLERTCMHVDMKA